MSNKTDNFETAVRPLAEELLSYAMKAGKKYGVTDAEIAFFQNDSLEVSVENNRVVDAVSGVTSSVSVILYAGQRILSFSDTSLDKDRLEFNILENARALKYIPEKPFSELLDSSMLDKEKPKDLNLCDNGARYEDVVAYTKAMEAAALAQREVKGTRSTSFERSARDAFRMATNGLRISSMTTMNSASIQVIAERNGQMEIDYEYTNVRHFSDLVEPETIGEVAAEKAVARLGAITPKTMTGASIILSKNAAAQFFGNLCLAIDGKRIVRGLSFFRDKLGEQVVSHEINLLDDPLVEKGIASIVRDASGLKSRPILFIENGVLHEYCADLEDSRRLKRNPVGREHGTTNVIIQPGKHDVSELASDIKEGVYISSFVGGKVDVNTGEHSREAHGLLIQNGRITDIPVSGFAIVGNLREMFNNLHLANDTPPMPNPKSHFVAPTTRLNKVTIAGR